MDLLQLHENLTKEKDENVTQTNALISSLIALLILF